MLDLCQWLVHTIWFALHEVLVLTWLGFDPNMLSSLVMVMWLNLFDVHSLHVYMLVELIS